MIGVVFRGREINFVPCTKDDVPKHVKLLKTTGNYYSPQRKAMLKAIEDGTAFTLDSGECFLYYALSDKEAFSSAVAIYGVDKPLETIAMLYSVFTQADKTTRFMLMKLHKNQKVSQFKSLFTKASVRQINAHEEPMMIRTDKVVAKYEKAFTKKVH